MKRFVVAVTACRGTSKYHELRHLKADSEAHAIGQVVLDIALQENFKYITDVKCLDVTEPP